MKIKNLIFNFLIFIIILNFNNIYVKSQIQIQYADDFDQLDGLNVYPTSTNSTTCSYSIKLWVIQLTGGDGFMTLSAPYYTLLSSNSTHYLFYAYYDLNEPTSLVTLTATGNGVSNQMDINLQCLEYNINSIGIEFLSDIYIDSIYSYMLPIKFTGVPTYSRPLVLVNGLINPSIIQRQIDDYWVLVFSYSNMYNKQIGGPLDINFYFGGQVITKTVSNFFNESFSEDIIVNTYPSDLNSPINLIGDLFYPIISIETKTVSKDIFFTFVSNQGGYISEKAPIYESNGKTTYLASTFSPIISSLPPQILSFYFQNKSSSYEVFNIPSFNVVNLPTTQLTISDIIASIVTGNKVPLLRISNSGSSYYLNNFGFVVNNRVNDFSAPFGFTNRKNSNYQYYISIPFSPYNPTVKYGISLDIQSLSVTDNTNVEDIAPPVVEFYTFVPMANNKYLLYISVSDQHCGVGSISMDDVVYKRMSQYRTSGDQYNGIYEIPIDFDLDLVFQRVTLMDLCGNPSQFIHGSYLPNIPFSQFNVPFFNYYYNLFKIQNVSFLYNNLDVRSQSVANIIYFTLDGADPLTPFSLKLPRVSSVNGAAFFTDEYYGSWNSTINKFQIEFVVPKNSRLGSFQFSIALAISVNSIPYSVDSNFFPSSSQLTISHSNFDGIGPIFSKVEKIPFENGKFGWSLTISDPINGFDNGTITVTGSEDNSIYKFDLFPTNATSGNSTESVYEIIIDLGSNYCIDQDYIITFVKLWDTGAQFTVFELDIPNSNLNVNQLINPFYLFSGVSTINKYSIQECNASSPDTTPPTMYGFTVSGSSSLTVDVGGVDRSLTFEVQAKDDESGINTRAQGPIVYIAGENLDIIQCITKYDKSKSMEGIFEAFTCTIDIPVGFGSSFGEVYFSVFGIINNHGLYTGFDTQLLRTNSLAITYTKNEPLLIESGRASSKGGDYFVYGRGLSEILSLNIVDTVTKMSSKYLNFTIYGTSAITIQNLAPIRNKFYVSVTTNSGLTSNQLLVSPVIFNSYTPSEDSTSNNEGSSNSNSESTPLPTNSPQQCSGSPICGGPTHGVCNTQTGCICIYPWKGKSCQDKVIEPEQPVVDPNEPSTGINIPDDTDDNGNPVNNIHYKSLISLYSLREVDINGNTVKNYKFNDNWEFNQISTLISNYKTNVTTIDNSFNTTISATLEWFNQSKVITFADQDLEMNANSIKYSIEISKYPFTNSLNYLQLVMSATLTSTSSTSCSSKDFGDTTTGDNSNYINIQIDNKSLYGRFIKRGIVDNNKVVALSNEILDSKLNAISTPSQSQRYVGITIPQFKERAIIDPDFSVLLNSDSASSKSNSVCKSKGLSGAKIAGIVIGSVAFVAIIVISVIYHFKKKKDDQIFKSNISNKLKEMNNNNSTNTPTV